MSSQQQAVDWLYVESLNSFLEELCKALKQVGTEQSKEDKAPWPN